MNAGCVAAAPELGKEIRPSAGSKERKDRKARKARSSFAVLATFAFIVESPHAASAAHKITTVNRRQFTVDRSKLATTEDTGDAEEKPLFPVPDLTSVSSVSTVVESFELSTADCQLSTSPGVAEHHLCRSHESTLGHDRSEGRITLRGVHLTPA